MQLKGFDKRLHNIFFHTHTVAGIVISFGLFIIFFAGAFALFMDEAYCWENPEARYHTPPVVDIDRAVGSVWELFPNFDRGNDISIALPTRYTPEIKIYGYDILADSTKERVSAVVNTLTYEATSFREQKTHVIETLYHLHYFGQIPFGRYISGLVALFFVFATVTGLLIHWKDMIAKFYALRTKAGRKNMWKDTHTTLGLIGLPFQLIFGISGAFLGLSILLLAPSVILLFGGSQDEIRSTLDPFFEIAVNPDAERSDNLLSFNEAMNIVNQQYGRLTTSFLRVRNHGTEEAALSFRLDDNSTLEGSGTIVVDLNTGGFIAKEIPQQRGYNAAYDVFIRLHYAMFGGIWIKFVYFLLSMITCYIIISGVLLWQSARDNKKYTDSQRLFHHRVTKAYLNICFSLFPATAVLFIANMVVSFDDPSRIHTVDYIFFGSWFILLLSGWLHNSYSLITSHYLILGGILSLLVPVSNGVMTGSWLWSGTPQWQVTIVDTCWLIVGILCLGVWYFRTRVQSPSQS